MTLFQIFELVNFIAGKFPSGNSIPPARFNILCPEVQDEWTATLYNELIAAQQNEALFNKIMSTTPLLPFKKSVDFTPDATGDAPLPDDYNQYMVVWGKVIDNGNSMSPMVRKIDIINDDTYAARRGSVLTRGNVKPFGKIVAGHIQVVPYNIGLCELDYFRKPTTPRMDWVQDATNPNVIIPLEPGNTVELANITDQTFLVYKDQYSNAHGDDPISPVVYYDLPATTGAVYPARTVELEWDQQYHYKFVYLILAKVGINLKETDVAKYAMEMSK